MIHYAIVPARNGSKSIINKNLQKISGANLVHWAINWATNADIFKKIIITTDVPDVINHYVYDGKVEVRERPEELCTDTAVMVDVVLDVLNEKNIPDDAWVWLLQPTSPFRKSSDKEYIIDLLKHDQTKSVISVKFAGAHHPNRCYTLKNQSMYPLHKTNFSNKQDLDRIYERSGNYYVFRCGDFKKQKTFYLKRCRPFVVDDVSGINIDSPLDLLLAKAVGKYGTDGWTKL